MAKKRSLAEADAEIAALRAQLAAATTGAPDPTIPFQRYPCVMFRKAKVTEKTPMGYEARRVQVRDDAGVIDVEQCDAAVAAMEKAGWVHSPAELDG